MTFQIDRNTALISILGLLFLFCVLLLVIKHNASPVTVLMPGLGHREGFVDSEDSKNNIPTGLKVELGALEPAQLNKAVDYINKLKGFNTVEDPDARMIREGFQATGEELSADIKSKLSTLKPDELDTVLDAMKARLATFGLLPEAAARDIDMSNYVPKSNIPPAGPRVDMSQYVKKSSIPPEKVCPPQKEIDYSQYVKKSTLPPAQKCPPCIAPKVQVSAGLCKKCPPCPTCPPPQRCPELKCPEPTPCPKVECPKCSEIKYIKVPTVITRTIKLDNKNNVVSDETVKDGMNILKDLLRGDDNNNDNDRNNNNNNYDQDYNNAYREYERERKKLGLNRTYNDNSTEWTDGAENNNQAESMETTTTTKAEIAEATGVGYKVPAAERASNKAKKATCDVGGLNSEFKKYGIYGYE
jgi:hypothetical protein